MKEVYQINRSCFRYIVPFFFDGSFEEAFEAVESQREPIYKRNKATKEKECVGERKTWERKVDSFEKTESDLFDYVKKEFCFEDAKGAFPEEKMGCEWLFWRSANAKDSEGNKTADGEKILELRYYPNSIVDSDSMLSQDYLDFTLENVGLYLFRNHIGFVWYEVEFMETPTSAQLIEFQHSFRELNRENYFWKKVKDRPACGVVYEHAVKMVKEQIVEHRRYITPFLMGQWLAEQLGFLNSFAFEFVAERKSAYNSVLNVSLKDIEELHDCIETIGFNDCGQVKTDGMVPDKALLFTYCSFDENDKVDEDRKNSLVYHLTNGYKNSYHLSDEVAREMKHPFSDVIWYATQEGAACFAWPNFENKSFFEQNFISKIKADYFGLYMKVLFQSYSLFYYAKKIQKEISSNPKLCLETQGDEKITRLFTEINLFLTKSMTTSVSNIHHQSEFYLYLKQQLRIHEDVKSVTSGLNALDSLQREMRQREENRRNLESWERENERDRLEALERRAKEEREQLAEKEERKRDAKVQAGVGLISVLAVASAWIDLYEFIAKFDSATENGWMILFKSSFLVFVMEIIGAVGVLGIGGYATYCAWKAIKEAHKKDKE